MSIEKTIEAIRETFRLYDTRDWFYIQKYNFDSIANAYEAMQAENRELREARNDKAVIDEFLAAMWEKEPRSLAEFVEYIPEVYTERYGGQR